MEYSRAELEREKGIPLGYSPVEVKVIYCVVGMVHLGAEISLEGAMSWLQTSFNFIFLFLCLLLQVLSKK